MALPETTLNALTKGRDGMTVLPEGSIVIDGRDSVHLYRLLMLRSALRLEIDTGLKMTRGSVLKATNAALGTNHRTKQKALDHLEGILLTLELIKEEEQ